MVRTIVKALNGLARLRRAHCEPEELLLLLPSCLQCSTCRQKVANDVAECLRCGRCRMKDVLELCDRYGIRCAVATGGRRAVALAREDSVKVIVAVACEKELLAGILAVLPKPAFGVVNLRPNGPCKDTDVDMDRLEEAVRYVLRA